MKNKETLTNKEDVMCWKLYLKELFTNNKITENEMKKLYSLNFRFEKVTSKRDLKITSLIVEMISKDMDNKRDLSFKKTVEEDVKFILNGEIKDDFEKEWKFYLYDCFYNKLINEKQYNFYKNIIKFDKPLKKEERSIINEILDLLRIQLVNQFPEIIECIENPSFNVLIAANNMTI